MNLKAGMRIHEVVVHAPIKNHQVPQQDWLQDLRVLSHAVLRRRLALLLVDLILSSRNSIAERYGCGTDSSACREAAGATWKQPQDLEATLTATHGVEELGVILG
jgi:hypothetical protein